MKIKTIIPIFILICVLTILSGCDDSISPVTNVSGKLLTDNPYRLKVKIGDKSVYADYFGGFKFNDIVFPFDVSIIDSINKRAFIFKDLSVSEINLPLHSFQYNSLHATINVSIPEFILKENLKGKLIFTNGTNVNSYYDISGMFNSMDISIPVTNSRVTGKLILLTYEMDSAYSILSYENYGESPEINVWENGTYTYVFDSLNILLNPGEESIHGTFALPAGLSSISSNFSLSFAESYNLSSYSGFLKLSGNPFSFIIPTGLPRQFTTIVEGSSYGGNEISNERSSVFSGSLNNIVMKNPTELISPDDLEKNVSNNSVFSYSNEYDPGIYRISLVNRSYYAEYIIVTSDNNFNFEELDKAGIQSMNNNLFEWRVEKSGQISSMNDYVTSYYGDANSYFLRSKSRQFLTAP